MTKSDGLRERKKQKTRDLLIDVALRLFLEKGFEETTIEEIAAEVEVSPRTFFRYFPTKEDVVFLDQAQEDAFLIEMISKRDPNEDVIDGLLRVTIQLFGLSFENLARSPQIFALIMKTPSLFNKAIQLMINAENLITSNLIQANTRPKEVRRVKIIASVFIHGLRASFLDWIERGMKEDPNTLIKEFGSLLKSGFQATSEAL